MEGGACILIRRWPVRRGADWRAGPGREERGGGRERRSLPAGSARAGSGLISNRGLDCSRTATLPCPPVGPPVRVLAFTSGTHLGAAERLTNLPTRGLPGLGGKRGAKGPHSAPGGSDREVD